MKFRDLQAKHSDAVRKDPNLMPLGPNFICEYLHVPDSVYREVYEPSEDTFLLIDSLHVDINELIDKSLAEQTPINNIIEVG